VAQCPRLGKSDSPVGNKQPVACWHRLLQYLNIMAGETKSHAAAGVKLLSIFSLAGGNGWPAGAAAIINHLLMRLSSQLGSAGVVMAAVHQHQLAAGS